MKVTVAFRDDALARAAIRVELGWLDRFRYGAAAKHRAWSDTVVATGASGAVTWTSELTGEPIRNRRIVDAIERERTRVAAWRRLTVIARHT